MDRQLGDVAASVPRLDAGVTLLYGDERSTAHHKLVLAELQAERGPVSWIDAGDTASTYALYECTTNQRLLEPISIARAWTAYQHHTLAQRTADRATASTQLIVAPNVDLLYRDDDVATADGTWLLDSTLDTLTSVADRHDVTLLLTTSGTSFPRLDIIDRELTAEATSEGAVYRGADPSGDLYRHHACWQTTLPYWTELLGTARSERWMPQLEMGDRAQVTL